MTSTTYFCGLNTALLNAVPPGCQSIMDVGCGEGRLGAALKVQRADRIVFGIEKHAPAAAIAARCLDRVDQLDLECSAIDIPNGWADVILFGDVLDHFREPEAVLAKCRRWLKPHGAVLASLPNVQHHSALFALFAGEFSYADSGLLDRAHVRLFTRASIQKMFLDAGFVPNLVDTLRLPISDDLFAAARPLLDHLRLPADRAHFEFGAYQYIFRAEPQPVEPATGPDSEGPLTFVVCVTNQRVLHHNLLASPDLAANGCKHQVIGLADARNAADAINVAVANAANPLVIIVHQDVYLPRGWCARFLRRWREAQRAFGQLGLTGVYGIRGRGQDAIRVGRVVDRLRSLNESPALPTTVDSLDELLLAFPKDTPVRFDANLGFHLYASDGCLQAQRFGLTNVVVDAVCLHNSEHVGLPREFAGSVAALAKTWRAKLPIATPCVKIAQDGTFGEW